MGTRAYYQIVDSEGRIYATLFANSSHSLPPLEIARRSAPPLFGPTTLLAHLLTTTYPTTEGNNYSGHNVFWLMSVSERMDEGDAEFVQRLSVERGQIVASAPIALERAA